MLNFKVVYLFVFHERLGMLLDNPFNDNAPGPFPQAFEPYIILCKPKQTIIIIYLLLFPRLPMFDISNKSFRILSSLLFILTQHHLQFSYLPFLTVCGFNIKVEVNISVREKLKLPVFYSIRFESVLVNVKKDVYLVRVVYPLRFY